MFKSTPNNNSKLYIRFVLLIIIIVSFTILVLSSVLYTNFETQTTKKIKVSVQDSLSQISYSATIMCELAKSMALQIYFDDQLFSLLNQPPSDQYEIQNNLRKIEAYKLTNPHIYSIYIYNRSADKFYTSKYYAGSSVDLNFYDFEMKEILDNFLDYHQLTPIARKIPNALAPESEKYTNVFSFIFSDQKNSVALDNAVIINISEEWLAKTINALEYLPNSSTFIIDSNGNIILNQNATNRESIIESSQGYLDRILNSSTLSGSFSYRVNNIPSLVNYTKLNNYDLIFVRTIPYNNVFDQIYKLRFNTAIIVLILLIVFIVLSIYISRRSYRPVSKLVTELNALQSEKGNIFLELRNKFLKELLFNNTDEEVTKIKNILSNYRIKLNFDHNFFLILITTDHFSNFINTYTAQERELMNFSILNIASEIFSQELSNEPLQLEGLNHNLLIADTRETQIEDIKDELYILSNKTQQAVQKHLNHSITITLSNIKSVTDLTELYSQVLSLSNYRLILGHEAVIFPSSISSKQPETFIYPFDDEKKLVDSLRMHRFNEAKKIYNEIVKKACEYTYTVLNSTIHRLAVCTDMTIDIFRSTMGIPINYQINNFISKISQFETLEEINAEFYKLFDSLSESIESLNTKNDHAELVKKVTKYMEKHFSDANLSLEIIAENFNLSPNYLGKIFKKQYSLSIPDYLNHIRMEKVKELLLSTTLSINEIILSAGYINAKYFSTLFKKMHGITPTAFRKIDSNKKFSDIIE